MLWCSHFLKLTCKAGKRRPALVVADAGGRDLILCQITSRFRSDSRAVELLSGDFEQGKLAVGSLVRPNRLFTVEESVIIYVAARVRPEKLDEVKVKLREIFA